MIRKLTRSGRHPVNFVARNSDRHDEQVYSHRILAVQISVLSMSFFSFVSAEENNLIGSILKATFLTVPLVWQVTRSISRKNFVSKDLFIDVVRANYEIFAITLFGILTSLWSVQPNEVLLRSITFLIALASLVTLNILRGANRESESPSQDAILYAGFAAGMAISLIIPIVLPNLYALDDPLWRDGRLGGVVIPPNTLGAFSSALTGAILLQLILDRLTVVRIALLGFLMTIWYLTYSRGAFLSMVGAFTVTILVLIANMKANMRLIVFGFVCALAIVTLSMSTEAPSNPLLILTRNETSASDFYNASNRTEIWSDIISRITAFSLIFGAGFAIATPDGPVTVQFLTTNHTHNGFLQVLSGTGIFCSIILFIFIWRLLSFNLRKMLYNKQNNQGFYFLIFFIISNISESSVGFQVYPQLAMLAIFSFVPASNRVQAQVDVRDGLTPSGFRRARRSNRVMK